MSNAELPSLIMAPDGSDILLLSSARGSASNAALAIRTKCRGKVRSLTVEGRPCRANLQALLAQSGRPDLIIALGGGSVIDSAKVVAMAAANTDGPAWFARWIGTMENLQPAAPIPKIVAVPTLVGSGAEMTPFATIWLDDHKISLEHPALKPQTVIRDASNLLDAPRHAVIFAALDAMSHALEAIWNRNATNQSDAAAHSALLGLAKLLPTLRDDGSALFGDLLFQIAADAGEAISVTRTALAHSMSYPLTCELGVPHGLASAFALPEIALFNLQEDGGQRLLPAASAFGCLPADMPRVIAEMYNAADVNRTARTYLARNALEVVRGSMIDPARAVNNHRSVTEIEATSLARLALRRIWLK